MWQNIQAGVWQGTQVRGYSESNEGTQEDDPHSIYECELWMDAGYLII